jgi:hypothetical protein
MLFIKVQPKEKPPPYIGGFLSRCLVEIARQLLALRGELNAGEK